MRTATTITLTLTRFLTVLLFLLSVLPTNTIAAAAAIIPYPPPTSLPPPPHHHKRHPYTLLCSSTSLTTGVSSEDIPLSRRCLGNPYKYRCDHTGQPDISAGGRTDEECDRKCDCRDTSTDPKPVCVALGGGSGGGQYWCGVGSGL